MITPKYLLPASLAATVHVALFWLLPEGTLARPRLELPLIATAPRHVAPIPPVPEETAKRDWEVAVQPLAGGPTPPEIDEPLTPPTKTDIMLSADERARFPAQDLKFAPTHLGPGEIGAIGEGMRGERGIFLPGELDHVPKAKMQLPPDYPATLRQAGVGGRVMVELEVNAEGRVVRADALHYTHREFAEPAVRAVKKWRFEAGRRNGQAVPFRMTVPIEFGIENR